MKFCPENNFEKWNYFSVKQINVVIFIFRIDFDYEN